MATAALRPVPLEIGQPAARAPKAPAGAGLGFAAALAEVDAEQPETLPLAQKSSREAGEKGKHLKPEPDRETAGDLLHLAPAPTHPPPPAPLRALEPQPRVPSARASPVVLSAASAKDDRASLPELKVSAGKLAAAAFAAAPSRLNPRGAHGGKEGAPGEALHEKPVNARKQTARANGTGHESAPAPVAAPSAQPAAGQGVSATSPASAPRAPEPAGSGLASLPPSLAASVYADDSLRLVVLPNSANLRVTTPEGGELSVQLRLRDGVANLTVAGAGSDAAMIHSSDLRAALAGQGLALGRIERGPAGAAAGTADVAGGRARVRAQGQGERRGTTVEASSESANELSTGGADGLARSLQ